MRPWKSCTTIGVAAILATPLPAVAADSPPVLRPAILADGAGFAFQGKTKGVNKTRQSASGIACSKPAAAPRVCLVVFDEGVEARYLVLNGDVLATDAERVVLLDKDGELDAEGAAVDHTHYYVTGSHAAKRKSCDNNPDGRHVLRFDVDPASGRVKRGSDGKLAGRKEADLWGLMQKLPGLAPHVGDNKCLGTKPPTDPGMPGLVGQRGVDIEGLATDGTRLFFGFRGPTDPNGTSAKILRVNAAPFFDGGDPEPVLADVEIGRHRGIRDLQAVPGGLLILAGPDDDADDDDKSVLDSGWIISFWDKEPGTPAKVLARLHLSDVEPRPCDSKDKQKPGEAIKPEGLAVLSEDAESFQVLVLSDGMCDGGPLRTKILKQP